MDVSLATPARQTTTHVNVVYTSPEATRTALATATSLSKDLEIRVRVLAFQVVPFPLALEMPTVPADFRLHQILTELKVPDYGEFTICHALCRDRYDALIQSLEAHSLVVIGGRGGVIRSREQRLARRLERMGHEVVFVATDKDPNEAGWGYRGRHIVRRWLAGFRHAGEHFFAGK
jgi:hypothetical protein